MWLMVNTGILAHPILPWMVWQFVDNSAVSFCTRRCGKGKGEMVGIPCSLYMYVVVVAVAATIFVFVYVAPLIMFVSRVDGGEIFWYL